MNWARPLQGLSTSVRMHLPSNVLRASASMPSRSSTNLSNPKLHLSLLSHRAKAAMRAGGNSTISRSSLCAVPPTTVSTRGEEPNAVSLLPLTLRDLQVTLKVQHSAAPGPWTVPRLLAQQCWKQHQYEQQRSVDSGTMQPKTRLGPNERHKLPRAERLTS